MNTCRFCSHSLQHEFIDLIESPPSNAFLKKDQLDQPEAHFPLKLWVCEKCFLVQIPEHQSAKEIFSSDYVYFSSFSRSWLEHCRKYSEKVISRFKLNPSSMVMEIASNDGYLLQYFKNAGIPVLGIEPTKSTAEAAKAKGIETEVEFFGTTYAKGLSHRKPKADLIAANNVLAHVPDINDFVQGIKTILNENGVFTGEFPHLLQLVQQNQFDTIYHEHFSYFSLITIQKIFEKQGLRIFDVEELDTHGGSLRIYADHGKQHDLSPSVQALIQKEEQAGMKNLYFYLSYQKSADQIKTDFMRFLKEAKASKQTVAGYGAAAKGNTLMNFCGVKSDLISMVADASPHKQGRYLPGSHIPVVSEQTLRDMKPNYVVIFPWNLKTEITDQLSYIREWGGKFVTAIPKVDIF